MTTIGQYIGTEARKTVRSTVGVDEKKSLFVPLSFKKGEDENDGRLWFEGFANTTNLDRHGDVILAKAWRKTVKDYLQYNPQVFYMHDWSFSIGQVTEAKVTKEGLWVRGYVQPAEDDEGIPITGGVADYLRLIRGQVKRGQLRTLSVGIRVLDAEKKSRKREDGTVEEYRQITNVELFENSLVTVPANRESVVAAKAHFASLHGEDVASSLVSVFDDYQAEPDAQEDEEKDGAEEKDTGPELELVSLHDRHQTDGPELILVSLNKERDDDE